TLDERENPTENNTNQHRAADQLSIDGKQPSQPGCCYRDLCVLDPFASGNSEDSLMPRSLITGGAGFVGSHLAEELLQRGDEVFVIDDLSTGRIDNIEPLKRHPKFHYVIDSVHNEPVLAECIDRCDMVYHLAAAVGVKLIVESPVNTIETNVHGTEVVLKLANKKK